MSTTELAVERRPASVLIVAVLVIIGAIIQLLSTAFALVLALRPGEAQRFLGHAVSDWYWIGSAVLSLLLALILIWIARGLIQGDPQAWLLVNVLALINLVFSVFQIPYGTGWASLLINALLLILNNTTSARIWFKTDIPYAS